MLFQVSRLYLWWLYVLTCLGLISFSRIPLRVTQQVFCSFCQDFPNSHGVRIHSSRWCEADSSTFLCSSFSICDSWVKDVLSTHFQRQVTKGKGTATGYDSMRLQASSWVPACLCSLCVCLSFWVATSEPSTQDTKTTEPGQQSECNVRPRYANMCACIHTTYMLVTVLAALFLCLNLDIFF